MSAALLEVKGLTLGFRGRPALLQAADLTLKKGEVLALTGASGAGKSLLARALLGLSPEAAQITAGEIGMRDRAGRERDLRRFTARDWQDWRGRETGMIFQDPIAALSPIRRIGDQLGDVIARHQALTPAEVRAESLAALRRMRLTDPEARLHAYPPELSGGQCQRVAIAMALAALPQLLIADEPTSGLDATTQAQIMALIRETCRARGLAVLFITHDLALAGDYADRICKLESGQIREIARPAPRALLPLAPHISQRPKPSPPVLKLAGLTKTFDLPRRHIFAKRDRLLALDGMDLTLGAGEALGIVGESGCGKSTLARLIARISDPEAGGILFKGEDIAAIPARRFTMEARRAAIQMVFQDPHGSLNPKARAFEAIAAPLRKLRRGLGGAEITAKVAEAAKAAEFPAQLLDRLPHHLSGGQKARLGLARALIVEPELLILDEPVAALDAEVQALVLATLARLQRERGLSLVFVSHDLAAVAELCQRVAVIYLGQIVEAGLIGEVFAAPQHPYTKALLAARPGQGDERALPLLEAEPLSPRLPLPRGCRFLGRCPSAGEDCAKTAPDLSLSHGRALRCHYPLGQ